jgi:acetolactate synthase-1/2/3 large subunit
MASLSQVVTCQKKLGGRCVWIHERAHRPALLPFTRVTRVRHWFVVAYQRMRDHDNERGRDRRIAGVLGCAAGARIRARRTREKPAMNGAQSLLETLVAAGVDVCFMNPGTSEMHFVAALDSVPQMRPVLALYEGVVTGAADGYARMTGRPAATLLHLGPGLTNGLSNVHNARRAHAPMLNVVGDHATYHKAFDAPLNSDIDALARPLSDWIRTPLSAEHVAGDAAEAVRAARTAPGQIATLILPADVSWSPARGPAKPLPPPATARVTDATLKNVANLLQNGEPSVLLLSASALTEASLFAAERVARKTGARLMMDTFVGRWQRGAGRPQVTRLSYFGEMALKDLEGTRHLILVGTKAPVAFFAYPDKPSSLVPEGCSVQRLAGPEEDCQLALEQLADMLGATKEGAKLAPSQRPERPHGALNSPAIAAGIGALLPEHAIVVDEGNTEGIFTSLATEGAPPHDWLHNTGGSIGLGLPLAVGAAIACPDRKVVCLEGDGSAMYTIQALWTMAREKLDITTVVFANRSYRILNIELMRVGASAGPRAKDMLDISRPDLDFVGLAQSMGVAACRPETADDFCREFERAMSEPGPHLIECRV